MPTTPGRELAPRISDLGVWGRYQDAGKSKKLGTIHKSRAGRELPKVAPFKLPRLISRTLGDVGLQLIEAERNPPAGGLILRVT